jgi:integrase
VRGELIALQWDALDLVAGRLVVKRNVWRGHFGPPRVAARARCPQRCDARGAYLKNDTCRNAILRASKRAGLRPPIGWHTLRHTFASHLVARGVPLKAVQELLGHATIEMTMRYAHLSPDVKKDAMRVLKGHSGGTWRGTGESPQ